MRDEKLEARWTEARMQVHLAELRTLAAKTSVETGKILDTIHHDPRAHLKASLRAAHALRWMPVSLLPASRWTHGRPNARRCSGADDEDR